jgi:lipopolysaccharide export system protein LptA
VNFRLSALRRLSLVLLLLWVAALFGTYLQRHYRRQPQTEAVEVESTAKEGQEQPVRVHKGFVYSDTLGIEPNFRIAAREAVEFSSGWYEFHDAQVSLYHEGRVAYGLLADGLRFNPEKHEAQTIGNAEVSLQGGVALRASGFTLGGPERVLQSNGPVTFAGPGWGGLAGGTRSSLEKNTMELVGGISVTWRDAATPASASTILLAPRLVYDRHNSLGRFPEGLTILRGSVQAKAARAEIQLSGPEGELRKLSLEGPVLLDGTLDDGSDVQGRAGSTELEALTDGRYRLTVDPATSTGWVAVRIADPATGLREFHAWRVVGERTRTAWDWLEGQGLACGTELRKDEDPRRVQAASMRLVFDGGQPRVVRASEAVRVETGDQWAEGGELEYSMGSRSFTLLPARGQRVQLGGPDSTAWCDRLQGDETGALVARGQVIGLLQRSGLMGQTETPVRFAAAAASADQGGAHVSLEGDARLWQGSRLVRADRLDYERAQEIVTGRGGVLTTGRTVEKTGPGPEYQVRARQLRYDRAAGVATYEGDVTLEDPQADASCQRLVATMDGKGNLILADLDGGVTVRDRVSARVMTGQKARLTVEDGFFEIWGNPVLVKEPSGNQVKANHLQWQRTSNTIVVLGAEDNPSETLYHPTKTVATPRPRAVPTRRPPGRTP